MWMYRVFYKRIWCATGLYCKKCGKWIKWLGKDELRLFKHEQSLKTEKKYTKDEVSEAIDNLRFWDNNAPFHEAVDKVLEMFENME